MTVWAQSTTEKLGDSVFQILAEVGMLTENKKAIFAEGSLSVRDNGLP